MKANLIILITALFAPLNLAVATIQTGDNSSIGDQIFSVYGFDLSPELTELITETRAQRKFVMVRSDNWDGINADIEVRSGRLYLTSLSIDWQDNEEFLVKVIPLESENGVFCSWFSGDLRDIEYGKPLHIKRITHFYFEEGLFKCKEVEKKGWKWLKFLKKGCR